ncbi:hypothetical protein [Novosphingobium sp.]|uniref:hypothetical protein n=1 Tax=Novosphingobium sp. TaxID=1874826 RepID=UPI0025D12710|nr:hypothetical protein [Novosphingobium sp.]
MKEPCPIAPTARLYVINETVALTITVGDQPPVRLEICRLAREPHCLILPIDPLTTEIYRTDDGEVGYAAFDIKIAASLIAPKTGA